MKPTADEIHEAIGRMFHTDSAAWNSLDARDIAEDIASHPFNTLVEAVAYYARMERELGLFGPFGFRDEDGSTFRDWNPIQPRFRDEFPIEVRS